MVIHWSLRSCDICLIFFPIQKAEWSLTRRDKETVLIVLFSVKLLDGRRNYTISSYIDKICHQLAQCETSAQEEKWRAINSISDFINKCDSLVEPSAQW